MKVLALILCFVSAASAFVVNPPLAATTSSSALRASSVTAETTPCPEIALTPRMGMEMAGEFSFGI
eukprot:scaffold1068_cov167-Amphora_coffeaeformis.AAC.15